jgi:hypothetical protein
MMGKPNLFDYATKELSQDAFICWLLTWAHPRHRADDAALHRTGRALLERLLAAGGINTSGEIITLEVHPQYKKIDVLVLVNDDLALLIEDKTESFEHSDQLRRYLDTVNRDFRGRKVAAVFLKTGEQCDYGAVRDKGYACFLRRDLLDVLEDGERAGVRSDVFTDFLAHLWGIEEAVAGFRHRPITEWNDPRQWAGFYTALKEQLQAGQWSYVPNPSGGFMCFHWHWNGNKYLQLEEEQLCFKIMVEDKAQQAAAWHEWHRMLVTAARESGLPVKRPDRRGVGTWMTVAVWDGEYRQANEETGLLDLERTAATLRQAEGLLDAAAAKPRESSPATPTDGS